MTTTTIIGMDISKYSFELCGTDERGRQTLHRRLHRDKVALFFANLPRCTVAMESCSGSQHWARKLTELGHQVMLIPAQHVVAYRQGAKNDRNDSAAIAEAATRPNIRLAAINKRIKAIFDSHPVCQQLAIIPGVGALVATAIIASVCEPQRFKNGRQFAAYLGLVPRQHSTGGKPRLLGICKAGNRYLRMLLVHGARSIIYHHRDREDPRSRWVTRLVERRGFHKANIALANKNARVVWKLLTTPGEVFSLPLAA
jgi:transposase